MIQIRAVYFCFPDPVEFTIETNNELFKDAPWHPDKPELGKRDEKIVSGSSIFIQKSDFEAFEKGRLVRLKNLCNVIVNDNRLIFEGMQPRKAVKLYNGVAPYSYRIILP